MAKATPPPAPLAGAHAERMTLDELYEETRLLYVSLTAKRRRASVKAKGRKPPVTPPFHG